MEAHVNCLPLTVKAKRNCESVCKGIERKAEQRPITIYQAASAGTEVKNSSWIRDYRVVKNYKRFYSF